MQQNQPPKALATLAAKLDIDTNDLQAIVVNTLVKAKGNGQATNEEFVTFLAIAAEYELNPLTKEIYAFSNRGSVQAIVSIDGWLKIINSNPQFDGMEFVDSMDGNGKLASVTCRIYRKDRSRPTEVTEYMSECAGISEPWKKWPARMLRHKATIQCARYAFGLSGIVDPDEADRIQSVTEKDVTPADQPAQQIGFYPADKFEANMSAWVKAVADGKYTPDSLLATISTRGTLTEEQKARILNINKTNE